MPVKQWAYCVVTGRPVSVITPAITMAKCLAGVISDHGMARYRFGFDPETLTIYSEDAAGDIRCHVIMIGFV